MTSPLPRRQPPAVAHFDREGTSWSEYVRRIDFVDRDPAGPDSPPIHVLTSPVLFDGVIASCQIAKEGITVDLSGHDGTVVSLWVHKDDVQIGGTDDDGNYTPFLLGDRRVCTPTGEGWEWVPVDPDDDDNPWIAVAIFVAEVHVR